MQVTEQHLANGCFTTIQRDNITLTVRTDHGTPAELAAEAQDMRKRAAALTRRADLIADALRHMEVIP